MRLRDNRERGATAMRLRESKTGFFLIYLIRNKKVFDNWNYT
jgi:hypothetical protein